MLENGNKRKEFIERMEELRQYEKEEPEGYYISPPEEDNEIFDKLEPFLNAYNKQFYLFSTEDGIGLELHGYNLLFHIVPHSNIVKGYFVNGKMTTHIKFPLDDLNAWNLVLSLVSLLEEDKR